jgi:NHS family xanthosine MFS transporter
MMTNGFGALIGSIASGFIIEHYFTIQKIVIENGQEVINKSMDWKGIWITFAAYSLVVAILFALFFRHKHVPAEVNAQSIKH